MLDWLTANETLLAWLAVTSVVTLVFSVVAVPWLVVRIPPDYFADERPPEMPWADRHPLVRFALHAGKNLLGAVLVIAGVAMLVLPGQGVLTIVVGIVLLDFPGKRAFERRVVRVPAVLGAINWLRRRSGRLPLVVDR